MSKWIGRIATLLFVRQALRVRIIDTEQATPGMDGRNPSGFWYWATYA